MEVAAILVGCAVAFIYYEQLNTMINTVKIDQRPWVTHTGFHATIEPNQPLSAVLPLINVGKSPALNFRIRVDDQILKPDELFTIDHIRFRDAFEPEPPIYPGMKITPIILDAVGSGEFHRPPNEWGLYIRYHDLVTSEQITKLTNNTLRLYLFEDAEYTDAFGIGHHTHWCGYLKPDLTSGVACDVWNDTDGEHP
jgi:hypothetical protein